MLCSTFGNRVEHLTEKIVIKPGHDKSNVEIPFALHVPGTDAGHIV